ncbi:SET domain-containing protein [Fictibacillus barbaricus]|uniref:SET domain-containing protein n=1 Tax=Fictibacillus barbaricus TaxID=182136 RepID=A0ABU1TWL6_9BACL|nr:SET domain-containing protein [Fictibacillus barbaricus]MDR7071612.1 hypothetical protein [Fictibacillus barbaricus]
MMHPSTEIRFVSEEIGVGVFATKFIPKGTIVWVLDDLDQTFDEEYVESLDPLRKDVIYKYAYLNDLDQYVLCWDHGRYINHSFDPNMIATAYEFELAARDIYPGEELTCDYGTMGDDESFTCAPKDGTSRTTVTADDYLNMYQEWDEMAREAFKNFNSVDQPLKPLVQKQFVDKVNAVAEGREPLDSIRSTFELE